MRISRDGVLDMGKLNIFCIPSLPPSLLLYFALFFLSPVMRLLSGHYVLIAAKGKEVLMKIV